jgi:6-phosphogluconolactonase
MKGQRLAGWLGWGLCLVLVASSGANCTPEPRAERTIEVPGSTSELTNEISTTDGSVGRDEPQMVGDFLVRERNRLETVTEQPVSPDAGTTQPEKGREFSGPSERPLDKDDFDVLPERPILDERISPDQRPPATTKLYVGQVGAITAMKLTIGTGKLVKETNQTLTGSLQFVAFHPKSDWLYLLNQNRVEAYRIPASPGGKFALLGSQALNERATHLTLDATGKYVFAVSYKGNQLAMFPIGSNGAPIKAVFTKGGVNNKTFCVKAHQVRVHPNNRFVYVPCLGSNHTQVFSFDATKGTLALKQTVKVQNGAGPRHLDFHPTKPYLYLLNELTSTVFVYQVNTTTGKLTRQQTLSNLPQGSALSGSKSSDIRVSADGAYAFAVNREPLNNIALYAIQGTGKLKSLGHVSTGGVHARTLAVGPQGRFLYVGNTKSKSLVVLKRNSASKWSKVGSYSFPTDVWYVGFRP